MKVMVAITEDGKRFVGRDYNELASNMAKASKEGHLLRYMKEVKRRCEIFDGSRIKIGEPETFLKELQRVGVIKEIKEI